MFADTSGLSEVPGLQMFVFFAWIFVGSETNGNSIRKKGRDWVTGLG